MKTPRRGEESPVPTMYDRRWQAEGRNCRNPLCSIDDQERRCYWCPPPHDRWRRRQGEQPVPTMHDHQQGEGRCWWCPPSTTINTDEEGRSRQCPPCTTIDEDEGRTGFNHGRPTTRERCQCPPCTIDAEEWRCQSPPCIINDGMWFVLLFYELTTVFVSPASILNGVYTDQGTARPRLPANKQQANADEARSLFVNIPGRHQHHHLLPMRMWWRKYRGTTHCQCYMRSRLGIGERYTVFHWNVEESLEIHMPRSSLSLNHLRP